MTAFFKDFYADWRDKTGSGYFTLFFLSSLVLWNWRVVLLLFAGDLTTVEKLERIETVTGPLRSFLYPAGTAALVCVGFAILHAVLSFVISGVELWRKSVLARRSASIRSSRRTFDAEEEAVYQTLHRAGLETRKVNAEKMLEILEQEARLRNSAEAAEAATTQAAFSNRIGVLLLSINGIDGPATVTFRDDRLVSITGGNLNLSPKSQRERVELRAALEALIERRFVKTGGDRSSGEYTISITPDGYRFLDLFRNNLTLAKQSKPADLTPETAPPSDP
ncbi:hypothetical protein [Rhodobacter sp. 24-YEA-8]|uniref:hypothetical protein n=1 Tax=Rhodobacter sp. 24-YEA-8 TaxID=1884310 RepID=UPI000896FC2A|nr:hypothetical protein [Rhodobacter sp. 24-YEA-8]SEC78747.1 hypothetical protein SAMN05519105_3288 [Rhodobacter sp. 24-YEA-8]